MPDRSQVTVTVIQQTQCNVCAEKATRFGQIFIHALAKFDDVRRGRLVGIKFADL